MAKHNPLSLFGLKLAAGRDIELPSEFGRIDPRLKKPKGPSVGESLFQKAPEGYRTLQKALEDVKKRK